MKKKHKCEPVKSCKCSTQAVEPNENCPVHGYPFPRCECGRFVKSK